MSLLAVPNNDLASFPKLYEENAEGVGLIRLRLTLRAARGSLSRCARLELRSNPTSGMGPAALDLEVPHGGRGGIDSASPHPAGCPRQSVSLRSARTAFEPHQRDGACGPGFGSSAWRKGWDSNPRNVLPFARFRVECLRPGSATLPLLVNLTRGPEGCALLDRNAGQFLIVIATVPTMGRP